MAREVFRRRKLLYGVSPFAGSLTLAMQMFEAERQLLEAVRNSAPDNLLKDTDDAAPEPATVPKNPGGTGEGRG